MSTPTNKTTIKRGPNSTAPIRQSLLTPLRQMGLSRKVKPPKSIETLLKGKINSPVDKCISPGLSRKSASKTVDKKGNKYTPDVKKDSDQSSHVSLGLNEETPKGRKFASKNEAGSSKKKIEERTQEKVKKSKFINDDDDGNEEEVIPTSENDSSSDDEPLKPTKSKPNAKVSKTKKKKLFIENDEEAELTPINKIGSKSVTNEEEKLQTKAEEQIKTSQNKTHDSKEVNVKIPSQNEDDEDKLQTQSRSRRKTTKRKYITDDDSEDESFTEKSYKMKKDPKNTNKSKTRDEKISNISDVSNETITNNDENSSVQSNKRKISPNQEALNSKMSNSNDETSPISKRRKSKIDQRVIIRIQGTENVRNIENNNKEPESTKKPVRRMLSLKKSISSVSTNSAASEEELIIKSKKVNRIISDDESSENNSQPPATERSSTLEELNDLRIQSQMIVEQETDDKKYTKEELEALRDEVYNLAVDVHLKEEQLAELKQAVIYKKLHDVNELQQQTNLWKKGCQEALEVLLAKLTTHYPITMQQILGKLNIPPELIGYDLNEECFKL